MTNRRSEDKEYCLRQPMTVLPERSNDRETDVILSRRFIRHEHAVILSACDIGKWPRSPLKRRSV
jgi:hypothetical protein